MNTITKIGFENFSIKVFDESDYNEIVFLNTVEMALGENYTLTKTPHRFCNVDYVVRRKKKVIGYMEVKVRLDVSGFNSLKIGYTKLRKIFNRYKETILVWYCLKTETLFSVKFTEALLLCDHDYSTYYIPKQLCHTGMDKFLELCRIHRW